jgi:hypothetical protein
MLLDIVATGRQGFRIASKCLVQTHGVRTWTGKPRQNTLRETNDARTKTAEKTQKSALRGSLSLDNRGPSMWPHLSSPFYGLPFRPGTRWSLWTAGASADAICWWLLYTWGILAPNDLLSVAVTLDRTPDPACARGAYEALGWGTPPHNRFALRTRAPQRVPHTSPPPSPLSSGPSRPLARSSRTLQP